MTLVRHPNVAGQFYPASAKTLAEMLDGFLDKAEFSEKEPPKAIIAPHAGYIYSGPVAATIYKSLELVKDKIKRVVLLGPSHYVPFRGVALSKADYFVTPIGQVEVDKSAIKEILQLEQVGFLEEAFQSEHSLEVHIPFLQRTLLDFKLVPLVVGDADVASLAKIINQLWGGEETLIVVSSDLSHYHDYDTCCKKDAKTSSAITELKPDAIGDDDACGRVPIKGLLTVIKEKGLTCKKLDLRNSGDTQGPKDRVVGYGSYYIR